MANAKDFSIKLEKALQEAKKEAGSRGNMQKLGNSITKDMVKRIQLGYGVTKNEGRREKFEPLAESTQLQRAGKIGFWTNSAGTVVPINTLSAKELKAFRANKSAKDQIKKNKEYLKKNTPKLAANTSAKKSNLTRTGLLMRNIGSLVTGFGKLTIGFKSSYGARVAAYVSKKRPFFFVTDKEAKRAARTVRKTLTDSFNKALRKYFK
jgi:hypothetical protein